MFGLSNKNLFKKRNSSATASTSQPNTHSAGNPYATAPNGSQNIGESVKAFLSKPFQPKKHHHTHQDHSRHSPVHVNQQHTLFSPTLNDGPSDYTQQAQYNHLQKEVQHDIVINENTTVAEVYGNFIYGDVFIEINQETLSFKRYIALMLFDRQVLLATPISDTAGAHQRQPKTVSDFIEGLVNLTRKESSVKFFSSWKILHCYKANMFSFVPISKQSVRCARDRDTCVPHTLKDFDTNIKNNRFAKMCVADNLLHGFVVMGRNAASLEVMVEKLSSLRLFQMKGGASRMAGKEPSQVKLPKPHDIRRGSLFESLCFIKKLT
jgi:hypothetical protein